MAAEERLLLLLAVNPPTRDGIIWANAFPAPKTETKLGLSLAHRRILVGVSPGGRMRPGSEARTRQCVFGLMYWNGNVIAGNPR